MEGTQPTTIPDVGAEASAQPTEGVQVSAGQPTEPTQSQEPQAPSTDDTAQWLSTKGFDPNDPDSVMKLAKSYREAEKLALSKAQEASELKKSLAPIDPIVPQGTNGDPLMQEFIQDYRRDKQINTFKDSTPDWKQYEQPMVSILEQTAPSGHTYSQLVNAGVLDLGAIYTMAKGTAPVNIDQIKTEAQQEVLQTLANTQRAGGVIPHASETNPKAPVADPVLEGIRKSRGA